MMSVDCFSFTPVKEVSIESPVSSGRRGELIGEEQRGRGEDRREGVSQQREKCQPVSPCVIGSSEEKRVSL